MNAAQPITCAALLLILSAVPSTGQASRNRLDTPDKIAAYVNDNPQDADLSLIWKKLRLAATAQGPNRCGCRSDECPGTCRATVFDVRRDAQGSWRNVLRVCYAGGTDCKYVVFKKDQQWRVVGQIDSLDNQYRPPAHRVVTSKEGCWFAIKQLSGRGTGFLSYSELWYDLSKSNLPVVLDYPVSGNSVQGDRSGDYEFTSTVLLNRRHPVSILVRYQVREISQERGHTGIDWDAAREYRICYEWDRRTGRFRFRALRSVLPVESDPVFFLAEKARRTAGSIQ